MEEKGSLTGFLKNSYLGEMGHFGPKIVASIKLRIRWKNLFKTLAQ